MTYELLLIFFLSAIPACFNFFLDYAIGHPLSDRINEKAILFFYPLFLAKRRTIKNRKYDQIFSDIRPLLNDKDAMIRAEGKRQLTLAVFATGKDLFSWELAFGICMFCTNFWVSLIAAWIIHSNVYFYFINSNFLFLLIPIFSHTILRKL